MFLQRTQQFLAISVVESEDLLSFSIPYGLFAVVETTILSPSLSQTGSF